MMNITINRDDYDEYEDFIDELKKALRYKGNLLAKQAVNTLDTNNMHQTLEPDYLYYRLFDDIGTPVEGTYSYIIIVEQIGGSGGYFFKYGMYRKPGKGVQFKVIPPMNMYVHGVSVNSSKVINFNHNTNIGQFTMPDSDAHVKIHYTTQMVTTSTVYWGIISNTSFINTINVTTYNLISIPTEEPVNFTIPYDNIGNMGYLWFATELNVDKQKVGLGEFSSFNVTGTFDEYTTNNTVPSGYKYYVHKWPTEVESLTFLKS